MNQKHVGWISLEIPMGLKIKKKKKITWQRTMCILLSSSLKRKEERKRKKKESRLDLVDNKTTLL